MKTLRYFTLAFIAFTLLGCDNKQLDVNGSVISPAPTGSSPDGNTGNLPTFAQTIKTQGPGSGGGGFADAYAMETLNIAKYALAQIIENTSREVFSDLPEGKRRDWIVNIIRNIEYRDVEESRYERPLKFNYDLEKEEIYATKYYSIRFPYGRFHTRGSRESLRILIETFLDILHELSHFYEIGNTEKSDQNSDYWAMEVLSRGLDEIYMCYHEDEDENEDADTDTDTDADADADTVRGAVSTADDGEDTKYLAFIHIASGMVNVRKAFNDPLEDFKQIVAEGSFLMPWTVYDANGDEQGIWGTAYWNYVDLSAKYTKELLPTIYSSNKGYKKGILKSFLNKMPYSPFDESSNNFEAFGQVKRTNDFYHMVDRSSTILHILDSTPQKYVKDTGELVIDRKTLSAKFTKKYEVLTDENQNTDISAYIERIGRMPEMSKIPEDQSYELKCEYHQPKINIIDYQGDMRLPSPF